MSQFQRSLTGQSARPPAARNLRDRLSLPVGRRRDVPWPIQVAIGTISGLAAVGFRTVLPLEPTQIPTLAVVVILAIVTTFVGLWAGIATAAVGGILSWYIFFNPNNFSLGDGAWVPLLAFSVISAVIITTSHLYRTSETLRHDRDMARVQAQAEAADLFAREMAHRLKNALAIVQSIAFQTLGTESPEAVKFAGRLKAIAQANEQLSEHVETPTARVAEVVDAALDPFRDERHRFRIESADIEIAATQVVSLALVIHELGTNALKYGALSTRDGWVEIAMKDLGDRMRLDWKERGGPEVRAAERPGFGSRLIHRVGLATEMAFEPDGVRCSLLIAKA